MGMSQIPPMAQNQVTLTKEENFFFPPLSLLKKEYAK